MPPPPGVSQDVERGVVMAPAPMALPIPTPAPTPEIPILLEASVAMFQLLDAVGNRVAAAAALPLPAAIAFASRAAR